MPPIDPHPTAFASRGSRPPPFRGRYGSLLHAHHICDSHVMSSELPRPDYARNMRLIGHCDQGGRPDGVQIMLHRGHAYVGHMFSKGFSVVDVRSHRFQWRPVHHGVRGAAMTLCGPDEARSRIALRSMRAMTAHNESRGGRCRWQRKRLKVSSAVDGSGDKE
jgi:hypothetical protein